jgi:hypothetical protein
MMMPGWKKKRKLRMFRFKDRFSLDCDCVREEAWLWEGALERGMRGAGRLAVLIPHRIINDTISKLETMFHTPFAYDSSLRVRIAIF